MIKSELNLDIYIEIIDRMLERQGLSTFERDKILKYPKNIELLDKSFKRRIHPKYVLRDLDKSPLEALYQLQESKKKPTTKEGKEKKFKRTMSEFGKGLLKPYHADKPLKSKKQGGTPEEHKQSLAIAFSKIGLSKKQNESYNNLFEAEESELTSGQQYAIKFVKSLGLNLISSPLQLRRGNLIFNDDENPYRNWMISNTGYIRTIDKTPEETTSSWHRGPEWHVLHRILKQQHIQKAVMDDDQWMEAASVLAEKVKNSRKDVKPFRESYVNRIYSNLISSLEKFNHRQTIEHPSFDRDKTIYLSPASKEEIIEAIKKLYNKYVKE